MITTAQERTSVPLLDSLATSMELRAPETYQHCQRTSGYAVILGRRLGLSPEMLPALEWGVFLHDIGTIHIPDRILKKTHSLCDAERQVMKAHAITGYAMLSSIPSLSDIADIVLAHHERYDGTGYPHRLDGHDIPLGARICGVVDCLDALTSPDEIIRRVFTFPEAYRYIGAESETRFDPQVVEALMSTPPEEWRQVQNGISQSHGHERHPRRFKEAAVSKLL